MRLLARIRAFFRRGALDRDFEQELDAHLAMLTEDNLRRGMTPEEARRAAAIRMGGAALLKEQHRAARGLPLVDTVLQDVKFAIRLMAKDRWFSAAAIAALALGIGANATGFTIVNAVFLRGLPFDGSDRIYMLSWQNRAGRRVGASYAEFQDLRTQTRTFATLAAYSDANMNLSDDRALPEQANGRWITANTFGLLRQPPLLGRDFTSDDERAGAEPVVLLGYSIWRNRYGADLHAIGSILRVNGRPATIVGVMPEGMKFPYDAEIWMPFIPTETQRLTRTARVLRVFGRLADGVDRRDASTELNAIARQLREACRDETKDLVGVRVETFTERFIGGAGRPMFYTVMGAVVFVLLIACANVANLLLSRSAARAREIAARMALGATRWRIVRQLLVESLVLGVAGGSLGLLLAVGGVRMFDAAMVSSGLPYWIVFSIDYVVFAYVALICVLTAVIFGLAPALHVSRTNSHDVLKEGGRGTAGTVRARRFGTAMVVTELALTIVLLVGAGSLIRSFIALYNVDLGIDVVKLMAMRLQLPDTKYKTPDARRAFFERLELRLAAIPGVEAAAVTTGVPPLDGGERLLETDAAARTEPVFVGTVTVSRQFFDVIGVRLLRGRSFVDTDGAPGNETVIINDHLARQFFPGEDPIGRRIRFTQRDAPVGKPPDVWRTIIGVAPLIKQGSPTDGYINAVVYIPYRQDSPTAASLLVHSTLPPASVMDSVRRAVQAIDPDQPVFSIQTLTQVMKQDRWWYSTWAGLFGTLAALGLVLSSVGLYAVMAYVVAQRTQEIGVRIALGARRSQVVWLVLRRAVAQVAMGLAIGLAGAVALRRVLPGGVADISAYDPVAILAILLLLIAVSLAACLVPARRAMRVDPVVALRAE
jgi:putative ABC transport system permease protein